MILYILAGLGYRPNLEQTDKKSVLTYDLAKENATVTFVNEINKLLDRKFIMPEMFDP